MMSKKEREKWEEDFDANRAAGLKEMLKYRIKLLQDELDRAEKMDVNEASGEYGIQQEWMNLELHNYMPPYNGVRECHFDIVDDYADWKRKIDYLKFLKKVAFKEYEFDLFEPGEESKTRDFYLQNICQVNKL